MTLRIRPAALQLRAGEVAEAVVQRRTPDGVECVVADNGCGIPEADRERIFDPFFTSKPPGEGTGLGLANAVRLAEELDGQLELVPPPEGARTAFALRLPAALERGEEPSTRGGAAGSLSAADSAVSLRTAQPFAGPGSVAVGWGSAESTGQAQGSRRFIRFPAMARGLLRSCPDRQAPTCARRRG